MTSMLLLEEKARTIVDDIFEEAHRAEEERRKEYLSALNIQSWFRGSRVRKYLNNLNFSATQIQRLWRGYLGRQVYRSMLKNGLLVMKERYYNVLAVKIQTIWRGYYVRKYVHNYYALKKYLKDVEEKNETIREKLQEFQDQQEIQIRKEKEESAYQRLLTDAKSKHHLISTFVTPGVFKSPFKDYPEEMEYRLQAVRPLVASQKRSEELTTRKEQKNKEKELPPLTGPKPQGPFKDPQQVLEQRLRQFDPTLRVQTSFFSTLEARNAMRGVEWATRVNDEKFKPFSKTQEPYVPLHHTSTAFGAVAYGTQKFRDEPLASRKGFTTVVAPVPLFDKFNKTYSRGEV